MAFKSKLKTGFKKVGGGLKQAGSGAINIGKQGYEAAKSETKAKIKDYKEERAEIKQIEKEERLKAARQKAKNKYKGGKAAKPKEGLNLDTYNNSGVGFGGKIGVDSEKMLFGSKKKKKKGWFDY